MRRYRYKAATAEGKVLEGVIEADSRTAVVDQIQARGQIPLQAEALGTVVPGAAGLGRKALRGGRVSRADVATLTVELATLLKAGMPVDRSLRMLARLSAKTALKALLERLHEQVRGGAALSDALAAEAPVFSSFYVNMVRAGESAGALSEALERLAEFLERSRLLGDSVLSKLIYPIVLTLLAGLSLLLLVGFVIPQFAELFADAGAALPLPTRIVMGLGDLFAAWGWLLPLAVVGGFLYLRRAYAHPDSRLVWDRRVLGWPLVGGLVLKLETARLARTLGTLLSNGVPLLKALTIARSVIVNSYLSAGLNRALDGLEEGQGLSAPLAEMHLLPDLAVQLIQVGEETSRLDDMLLRVADIYERQLESATVRLLAVLEPALILGLGLAVAAIIMSLLVAILSVNDLVF